VEIGRIIVQAQPRERVGQTPFSTNTAGAVIHAYNPSSTGGIGGRIVVHDWPQAKSIETLSEKYLKQKKAMHNIPPCSTTTTNFFLINQKRAWDMAQVVECLPSKHKALTSNSSSVKKFFKKKQLIKKN
jgi:hypothetical protein